MRFSKFTQKKNALKLPIKIGKSAFSLAILKKKNSEIQVGKYDVFFPRVTFPREAVFWLNME